VALRWWPLGVATIVAVVLALADVVPRWPGLAHLVAVPPVDVAADLRILVTGASSYPAFAVGVGASVVIRSLVLGSLLFTLGAVPTFGSGMARAAALYIVAAVPLAIAAALGFAGFAAVYAWYGWAALGLTLLVVLAITPRLIPRGARLRRIPAILGYVLVLTILGALADLTGPAGSVVSIVVSAGLTAVVLDRLTRPPEPAGRTAPAAATALLAVGLVGWGSATVAPAPAAPDAVLLVVPGVDTATGVGAAYRLDPAAVGFECDRVFYYSYRGPGGDAPRGQAHCPIRLHRPYAQPVTQRPLAELVEAFAQQVEAIRAETGDAPVVVVTHSQGAVIAWRAVATGAADGVSHVVAMGGFPHSPVGYPAPGETGDGRVGADALRVLSWFSRFLGVAAFDPDAPLARELLARPDGLEDVFAEPLPEGVTAGLLFATPDLIVAPEGSEAPEGTSATVDTTHASMPESPLAQAAVRDILAGRTDDGPTFLAAILGPALPSWLPPPFEA
jgi:pimeloyl-ACP methyl ester carboxylesterase